MLKHLLFTFLLSLFVVSVVGQSTIPSSSGNTNVVSQEFFVENFSLSEAYPNPASTETRLDFKIPVEAKKAKIIIRSLLGHIMAEHLLEGLSGTKTIPTNELAGGIYFWPN